MDATQLFCARCKQANPVRKRVALYLPSGTLYHYNCARCGELVGKKTEGPSSPVIR